jgi:hypothetical protein
MEIDQNIFNHLFENKDFLKSLGEEFNNDEIIYLGKFSNHLDKEFPDLIDQFHDWLSSELCDTDTNILTIGWESDDWGPGGDGFISFGSKFGIIKMFSSDYEDDHIEIFNKKDFEPWCIENLMNDYLDISSDVYSAKELKSLAKGLGMNKETKLTVTSNLVK